jgi:nitrogen fixation NifU-like protein
MTLDDLYRDELLDHHRAPRNAGRLSEPSHSAELHNPLCGDRVIVTLRVEAGRIRDVACDTRGCAICRASGSMMTEAVVDRQTPDALTVGTRFREHCATGTDDEQSPGETPHALGAFAAVRRYPNRLRCATLPWEALEQALRGAAR